MPTPQPSSDQKLFAIAKSPIQIDRHLKTFHHRNTVGSKIAIQSKTKKEKKITEKDIQRNDEEARVYADGRREENKKKHPICKAEKR
jgi:hypothetical protein